VNSGRSTREGSIEDTALKTNLEACDEVARQLRLRDLAGLIVIDFIDMEERKNNASVEKRLKDKLKTDRARIQVGRISGFGLMEMSRQRLRPGMLESTTQPCAHCHGTGLIRSDDSLGLQVLRALEEEGTRKRSKEVLLRAPIGIVNFLINGKREHIALIEARYGMSVRIECDPAMISPDYSIEKFKTATRVLPQGAPVISGNASLMGAAVDEDEGFIEDEIEEDDAVEDTGTAVVSGAVDAVDGNGTGAPGKKKRRRRRRKKGGPGQDGVDAASQADGDDDTDDDGTDDEGDEAQAGPADAGADQPVAEPVLATPVTAPVTAVADAAPPAKPRTRSRTSKAKTAALADAVDSAAAEIATPKPKPARASTAKPRTAKPKSAAAVPAVVSTAEPDMPAVAEDVPPAPDTTPVPAAAVVLPSDAELTAPVAQGNLQTEPEDNMPLGEPEAGDAKDDAEKPKRRGWWSLGR